MTDRVNTLTVVLERPIRDDDVQPIVDAIRQMRHVLSVELGELSGSAGYGAVMQRDRAWRDDLTKLLREGPDQQ